MPQSELMVSEWVKSSVWECRSEQLFTPNVYEKLALFLWWMKLAATHSASPCSSFFPGHGFSASPSPTQALAAGRSSRLHLGEGYRRAKLCLL